MTVKVISYGGGVQSTAMLALAAANQIDYRDAVFSNVGDRAENPATLRFVEECAVPFASRAGIDLHQIHWETRKGRRRDLFDDLVGPSRSIDIPVKMEGGAPGNRKCTARYKLEPIRRWCRTQGATADDPATIAVGISTDEAHRATNRRSEPDERIVYPLLELGLSRNDCRAIIHDAGLPVPPKSSCWFCPFQTPTTWAEKRRDDPGTFAAAVALEDRLNEKRVGLGRDRVYLAVAGQPLRSLPEAPESLFGDGPDSCDSWGCWT